MPAMFDPTLCRQGSPNMSKEDLQIRKETNKWDLQTTFTCVHTSVGGALRDAAIRRQHVKRELYQLKRDLHMRPADFLPMLAAWHVARRRNAQTCQQRPTSMKRDLQMRPIHTAKRPISMWKDTYKWDLQNLRWPLLAARHVARRRDAQRVLEYEARVATLSKETHINEKRPKIETYRTYVYAESVGAWSAWRHFMSKNTYINEKRPTNQTYTHYKETNINVKRDLQMRPTDATFAGGSARCATPGCADSVGVWSACRRFAVRMPPHCAALRAPNSLSMVLRTMVTCRLLTPPPPPCPQRRSARAVRHGTRVNESWHTSESRLRYVWCMKICVIYEDVCDVWQYMSCITICEMYQNMCAVCRCVWCMTICVMYYDIWNVEDVCHVWRYVSCMKMCMKMKKCVRYDLYARIQICISRIRMPIDLSWYTYTCTYVYM